MNNIQIVCDGIANMPKELAQKYNIHVVPLTVNIDDIEMKESEITNEEFYVRMREAKEIPKTSQATYVDFKEVFEKYTNEGKAVLYIAGSSKSSGTYQSGMLAKSDTEGDIEIFDSMSISFGCGMLVLMAARMAEKGYSIEEILSELEGLRDRVHVSMALGSLEYLKKGGRISSSKAFVGTALNLKPILTLEDGLIVQETQVRGSKKMLPAIIKHTKDVCGEDFSEKTIAIACGDNLEDRDRFKELIESELNPKELILLTVSPVVCSHTGPDFIGLACFR